MIVFLEGKLAEATPVRAVIECQGIGYEVHIPVTAAEKLPGIGETVRLLTVAIYREDDQTLYGFCDEESRDCFKLLLGKVSGIGPRIALNILSKMPVSQLRDAIAEGNVKLLSSCPGIGKKTAERLVVELRDKVGFAPSSATAPGLTSAASQLDDATAALLSLGFKEADAAKRIAQARELLGANATTEALVRRALT